ncbi:MAG TPA: diacylglycerol kinase family protein [Gemmatimonadales bacterium]|nr:diacylglycerol kinase family protein [Gemmatimonadales bacterium]
MSRALLITNPGAGRMDPRAIRAVTAGLAARGMEVDVAGTTRPGDAADLARQGVDDGVDLVAVYGGDGTAMQAVRGLAGRDVPVGLIPGGTGNILAGNLRIPNSPARAAEVVARGVTRRLDLGRVERDDGPHYFAVNCGAGFDAQLMAGTTGPAKRRWGMAAYVAEALRTLGDVASVGHRITVDGEAFEARAATVMIANCAELVPPFIRLKADIVNDDGLFDVIVLEATGIVGSVAVMSRLLLGSGREHGQGVRFARGRRITVEAEVTRPVQLDGEPTGTTPFTAEVLPGALRVFVP